MAHYADERLGVSFDIADRFTVREQLAFRSKIAAGAGESSYVRYWLAAGPVMREWACELIPDPAALDLDATDDGRVADIVQWTANTVAGHMSSLETPPKN